MHARNEEKLFSKRYGDLPGLREEVEMQQHFEDLLVGPNKWVVGFAEEDDYLDAIVKFKENKESELLVKVKFADGHSNGWYQGSVNSHGLLVFAVLQNEVWTGNIADDGTSIGMNVGYGGSYGGGIQGGMTTDFGAVVLVPIGLTPPPLPTIA